MRDTFAGEAVIKGQGETYLPMTSGQKSDNVNGTSSYEAYKLIVKGDPQRHYKLPVGETIKIINVATATEQAGTLATAVRTPLPR